MLGTLTRTSRIPSVSEHPCRKHLGARIRRRLLGRRISRNAFAKKHLGNSIRSPSRWISRGHPLYPHGSRTHQRDNSKRPLRMAKRQNARAHSSCATALPTTPAITHQPAPHIPANLKHECVTPSPQISCTVNALYCTVQ